MPLSLSDVRSLIERASAEHETVAHIRDVEITGFDLSGLPRLPGVHLRFHRVRFAGNVSLDHVIFSAGASFIDVDFTGDASFAFCRFDGPAYFWRCRFAKKADFFRASVTKGIYPNSHRCPGEANFSYSVFNGEALFRRTVFTGPVYCHRTVFRNNVNFNKARFEDGVTFDSTNEDVLISSAELPVDTVKRLVARNRIHKCGDRKDGYYNFDHYDSEESLYSKLGMPAKKRSLFQLFTRSQNKEQYSEEEFAATEKQVILDAWKVQFNTFMFSWLSTADFTECHFGGTTRFRNLSLRSCLLRGTSLQGVDFDNVTWDDRHSLPLAADSRFFWSAREKISDELAIRRTIGLSYLKDRFGRGGYKRSKVVRLSISTIYHELRAIYEKKGERQRARDFYYGEMEMARLAAPIWRRFISAASVYKLASGYGTKEGLALVWLIVLVFGAFPLLYHRLNVRSGANASRTAGQELLHVELASLEGCTFLRSLAAPGQVVRDSERLLESAERIVVPLQAALLVLAVKSRFQRGPD